MHNFICIHMHNYIHTCLTIYASYIAHYYIAHIIAVLLKLELAKFTHMEYKNRTLTKELWVDATMSSA